MRIDQWVRLYTLLLDILMCIWVYSIVKTNIELCSTWNFHNGLHQRIHPSYSICHTMLLGLWVRTGHRVRATKGNTDNKAQPSTKWQPESADKNQDKKARDRTRWAKPSRKQLLNWYHRVPFSIDRGYLKADALLRLSLCPQGFNMIVCTDTVPERYSS